MVLFPLLMSVPSLEGGGSVSGCSVACHAGILTIAWAVGVLSGHDMLMVGAGEAPVPCLQGEGRLILPSPSKAVWNSSVESLFGPAVRMVAHRGLSP
jgi:hypothetical protein